MSSADLERARSALSYLSPDMPRDDWVKVGMAIKAELGEEGFDMFDEWSRQSDKYVTQDTRDTWKSCSANGGIGGGTLFYLAQKSGWHDNGTCQKPSPEEIAERRRIAAERASKEDAERDRRRAGARQKVVRILECARPASADHPYLLRKKVAPVPALLEISASRTFEVIGYAPSSGDEPLVGRLLVAPVSIDRTLSSVEFIDEAGRKSALVGGAKSGGYWAAQELPDGDGAGLTLLTGEGVATVLSAREATGHPVIAALTDTNLPKVAKAMRKRYPKAVMAVLADLVKATGETNPHAIEAARTVGGLLVIPDFGDDRPVWATDLNDLHQLHGLEAVAECIRSQVDAVEGEDEPRPGNGAAPGDEAGSFSSAEGPPRPEDAPGSDSQDGASLEATVRRLADLSPIEYDRVRNAEAEQLGVRVTTLDAEIARARAALNPGDDTALQGQAVAIDGPEPWPDEVDGAGAVNGISETLSRHLALPDGAADAMALWTAHAHCHMAFLHSPRLNVTSPERGCGKTLLIDVLHPLTPKAIRTENITTAVLFRLIDKHAPTLLIDEYDCFIHDNEELRGALNAGHKRGGVHLRCEGDKNEVRAFRTFAPVVLAGIRDLPGTLLDRSIVIRMQRMGADEKREPFDERRTESEKVLCRKLARWARDNFQKLEAADPKMPAGAGHRVLDNWRPLFAIADQVGGDWPDRVRKAFALLAKPDDAAQSRAEMLLGDFRALFAKHGDWIMSAAAVGYLVEMEDRPWPEYSRGKPITARQIAAALRRFAIKPVLARVGTVGRGYVKDHFIDAFKRYLPLEDLPSDPLQRYNVGGARVSEDLDPLQTEGGVTDRKSLEAKQDAGCNDVTDRDPRTQGRVEVEV